MSQTKKPVIGITSSMSNGAIKMARYYHQAIYAAGGIPVFLPYTGGAEAAKMYARSGDFDGILFAGGCDIDPHRYGEEITGAGVEICEERDEFELALAEEIKNTNIPILGICRGIQTMNVAFGGTLYQDIPGHKQEEGGSFHERRASVVEGTLLHSLVGSAEIATNSFHHQAVKVPAPGFRVAATADDGIIEAIEPAVLSDRFILGVQWHPERYHDIDETSAAIFRAFVNAAKNNN